MTQKAPGATEKRLCEVSKQLDICMDAIDSPAAEYALAESQSRIEKVRDLLDEEETA